jgi:hypothetical protein
MLVNLESLKASETRILHRIVRYRQSAIFLILVNLLPLLGVIFWGWDVFSLLCLYWAETVVIFAINLFKMVICSPSRAMFARQFPPIRSTEDRERQLRRLPYIHHGAKVLFIPVYGVFWGVACLIHGLIVFVFFGQTYTDDGAISLSAIRDRLTERVLLCELIAITLSHLFSFFFNYVGRNEFRRTFVGSSIGQPFQRVATLQIMVFVAAIATIATGGHAIALVLLVLGKTYVDLRQHLIERQRFAQQSENGSTNDSGLG